MNSNKNVTAYFEPILYHLEVAVAHAETGTVNLSPSQTPEGYLATTLVTLTASPAPGYAFSHWEGGLEGSDNPRDLVITDNRSVTAVFYPIVEVVCGPSNGGTVTLEPGQPPGGYAPGTVITVSAVPAEGYAFGGWSGDVSGSENPLTITVDGPKNIAANFLEQGSFPWRWFAIGVVGFLLVGLLAYFIRTELSRS